MKSPLKYLVVLAACGLAGGLAWHLLAGGSPSSGLSSAEGAWHFQDGKWVRLSPGQVARLMEERASRADDKVRVTGTLRVNDGTPLRGAEVVFASGDGEHTATADETGRYVIELAPSFYRVYARAEGFVAAGAVGAARVPDGPSAGSAGAMRSDLAPSLGVFRDLANIDIDMQRAGVVSGIVRDRAGAPVAGAVVHARSYSTDNPRPVGGTDIAVTDAGGAFRLVLAEGPHKLDASHADLAGLAPTALRHVTALRDQPVSAELTMVPGCIITGMVVDHEGRAVRAGPVEMDIGGEPPNEFAPVTNIADDGTFRVALTELGNVRLRAWPWKSPPTGVVEIECRDGTRRSDLRLVVEAPGPGDPALSGTLVDASGTPMEGRFVDLLPEEPGGIAQQERSGEGGAFAFYRVPPGRYRISSHVEGHGVVREAIRVPSQNLRLELSGIGALAGRVKGMERGSFKLIVDGCRDPEGDAPSIDYVAMPPKSYLVPVEEATFHVRGLPACDLEARAETPYRSVRLSAEIRPDQEQEISLDLRQPHKKRLHGLVLDDGAPVVGAAIIRLPSSGTDRTPTDYALTSDDGRYAIWVYSGDRIHVAAQDGRAVDIDIDWDGDREERITTALDGQ